MRSRQGWIPCQQDWAPDPGVRPPATRPADPGTAADRGVVEDRPSASGAEHCRDLLLQAVEDAGELLQFRVRCHVIDGMNWPGGVHAAGVVDRAVQLAEFSHGRATSLSTSRSTVTSVAMNSARPPPLRISAAACSPTSLRRPPITTVAPSETTRPATARPIPLAPPVTITTLDARRPTMGPIFPQQPRGPGDQRYGSESSVPLPGQPCPPGAEERPPRGRSVRARIAHAGSLVMPVPRPCTAAGMIGRLGDASPILFRGAAFRTRLIARGLVRAAR